MRISPQTLCNPESSEKYRFNGRLVVRTADLRGVTCDVSQLEAFAMACRCEIEAVCTQSGRIKYFRELLPEERPTVAEKPKPTVIVKSGPTGAALRSYYEEEINGTLVGTLGKARQSRMKSTS